MANNFANSINSNIGASNSGATNTLTVTNPSNTASSQALVNITVGGTSAGDAFATYTVSGTTNWSQGVDNSAADSFVLAASTALGTLNTHVVDTAGNTTFNNTGTSALLTLNVLNSDTNAASTSSVKAGVANASAADPYLHVSVNATSNYCYGIDNSDSDKLKINFDAAEVTPSGGSNLWTMTSAGERTMPLQPAFLAFLPSSVATATGDATTFVIGTGTALTEVFDQSADFNTNGTFTSPVTGRYQVSMGISIGPMGVAHTTGFIVFTSSNGTYDSCLCNPFVTQSVGTVYNMTSSVLADMDAADTVTASVNVTGGAKTVSVVSNQRDTFFSGYLAC